MSAVPRPAGPGRPKDAGKRAAILAAAKALFVARGFEATSMDAVAQAAGVSKLTVYNHFSDKETLFRAAVTAVAEQYLPHALFEGRGGGSIRERLLAIATRFYAMACSTEAEAMHRLLAADPRVAAQLGPLFYDAGPKRVAEDLAEFLGRAAASGELELAEPLRAAQHFLLLLKGEALNQMLWGRAGESARDGAEHVAGVVAFFLRAYQPR